VAPDPNEGPNHLVFHGPGQDEERFLPQFAEDRQPQLRNLG
jgi:coenzyme F420-dependent glucose-6-phosphate dehydrogenase